MLKCLCDRNLIIEESGNMNIYKHEDGSFCKLMNRFDLSVDKVNELNIKRYNDREYYIIIKFDYKLRMKHYKSLSRMNKNELENSLMEMSKMFMDDSITTEMAEIFGEVIIGNLEILGITYRLEKIPYKLSPKLHMINLNKKQKEDVFNTLSRELGNKINIQFKRDMFNGMLKNEKHDKNLMINFKRDTF